jgi:D-threo-aldose 1-dehydrogenase
MIRGRRVGRTGLMLPELGFGTAPLGNLFRPVENAGAVIAAARGLGYADTAPFYGFGLAEKRLGAAGTEGLVVSTKVGRVLVPRAGPVPEQRHCYFSPEPFDPVFDYSHDGVLRSHEASLKRLGRERVELLFVHDIGRETHGERHAAMVGQLVQGGGFRALEGLRDQGVIDGFGLGVNEVAVCLELMEVARFDAILLAGRYTLLEQGALDALLPRCEAEGTSLVIGGPYNSGILSGSGAATYNYGPAPANVRERAARIASVCAAHGVAVGAAALQFPLAHPGVASVIPGLASVAEVEQTLERYRTPIAADLWAELKAEGLLRADAPTPIGLAA